MNPKNKSLSNFGLAIAALFIPLNICSAYEYPRTGNVGCQAPLTMVRAGSSAGAKIREIAAVSEGFYCSYTTNPSLDSHPCTRLNQVSGRDSCTYSSLQPNGVYHDVTYPAECFQSLLPSELQRFYGSHWLTVDASGVRDACQFAAYPWRLICETGRELVLAPPAAVAARDKQNGYTCRSTSTPYTYRVPTRASGSAP